MKLSWRERAACADTPDFLDLPSPEQQQTCRTCPVRHPCLEFALEWERKDRPTCADTGWPVYGGLTGRQRLELIRRGA